MLLFLIHWRKWGRKDLMFSPESGQLVSDDRRLSESLDKAAEVTDLNCWVRCNTIL